MPPILQGPRVTLRPPLETDIDVRLELGNDPDIHRFYGGSRADLQPFTQADAAGWYRRLAANPYGWAIEHGRLIGAIRLDNINALDKRASLAIGIADVAALGRGLGTEAIGLVADHAFGAMGLHRLAVRVLAFNARAIRAYQKCGFRVEGLERGSALIDGAWHDDVIMGLLADDSRSPEREHLATPSTTGPSA
jgi:RimJ/RimL family protein N-acetyltransferase